MKIYTHHSIGSSRQSHLYIMELNNGYMSTIHYENEKIKSIRLFDYGDDVQIIGNIFNYRIYIISKIHCDIEFNIYYNEENIGIIDAITYYYERSYKIRHPIGISNSMIYNRYEHIDHDMPLIQQMAFVNSKQTERLMDYLNGSIDNISNRAIKNVITHIRREYEEYVTRNK